MKYKLMSKIQSFSLFEVSVALTILSILIGVIGTSINRLNEQLKISSHLTDKINYFYTVRTDLWREFYLSDSIQLEQNMILVYSDNDVITYSINDNRLHKKKNDYVEDLKIEVLSFEKNITKLNETVQLNFLIGEQNISMRYILKSTTEQKINSYFSSLH